VALFDRPLSELVEYRPEPDEPSDFDEFWAETITQARAAAWQPRLERVEHPLRAVDVVDLRFAGFGGHEVSAWLLRPAGVTRPLPVVVEFNGYGGGRGLPHEHLPWVGAGYAHVFMDTRGLERPHDHYYRRVFTDGVRLVETLRGLPGIDPEQAVVTGTSQGGGIALAVAGLTPGLLGAMPDVPFGSHWRWAVEHTDEDPFAEVQRYLAVHRDRVDQVFNTLSYLDGLAFARRAYAPALFSVGLMDGVCPPSTVFAAHNAWAGPASIEIYPFNGHEGGGGHHLLAQARFLDTLVSR